MCSSHIPSDAQFVILNSAWYMRRVGEQQARSELRQMLLNAHGWNTTWPYCYCANYQLHDGGLGEIYLLQPTSAMPHSTP
jgi:hypothetical protein